MNQQTDGVEWVMMTLFGLAILIVVFAAVWEIRKARAGDPGGEPESTARGKPGDSDPPT